MGEEGKWMKENIRRMKRKNNGTEREEIRFKEEMKKVKNVR